VVQGLAWGADLPVVPVSSLAVVAQTAVERGLPRGLSRICVAMDARMQEVYTADFELDVDGYVIPSGGERVCPPSQVRPEDPGGACAVGNGFEVYPELEELAGLMNICLPDCWPRASTVSRLASRWLESNKPLPAERAQPVYIRNQVAVKPSTP
jgi:tRNA threonylcarbamoyladenosine biosynthesis protein TsaB